MHRNQTVLRRPLTPLHTWRVQKWCSPGDCSLLRPTKSLRSPPRLSRQPSHTTSHRLFPGPTLGFSRHLHAGSPSCYVWLRVPSHPLTRETSLQGCDSLRHISFPQTNVTIKKPIYCFSSICHSHICPSQNNLCGSKKPRKSAISCDPTPRGKHGPHFLALLCSLPKLYFKNSTRHDKSSLESCPT